jgi:hypothetical protein
LLRQPVRAAIQVPGITITLLAGVFPFVVPFLIGHPVAVLVLGFVPLMLLSGFIALWAANPETYAQILVAGRPAKEVLYVISWHFLRTCKRTRSQIRRMDRLVQKMESRLKNSETLDSWDPETEPIKRVRERLRKFIQKEHRWLLRLEAMKLTASRELDIPQRRLCDHVFQYSPQIHRDRLQNYLRTWDEILNFPPIQAKDIIVNKNGVKASNRLNDLLNQHRLFAANTERRIRYGLQLLSNRDLHSFIVQLASMHSTSGSLTTYAEALKFLIVTGRIRKQSEEAIIDRLYFLHRKQRAHPGFDLHTLLLEAIKPGEGAQDIAPAVRKVLTALAAPPSAGSEEIRKVLSSKNGLQSFDHLPRYLARLTAKSRHRINHNFANVYYAWFKGVPRNCRYIIAHGYSKTVLSALKATIAAEISAADRHAKRQKHKLEHNKEEAAFAAPRMFFILPKEKKSLDTRIMEYELKEHFDRDPAYDIAAGSGRHLFNLLKDRDSVLILLGAECFDAKGRVVHPRGIGPGLDDLTKQLKAKRVHCLTVVVAESYKRHTASLAEDTIFYRQHFDRIELYPSELIHLIITNAAVKPEDWRNVMNLRHTKL